MILKSDVALERPTLSSGELAHLHAIQLHRDLGADCIDLETIPLPERFRVEHRCWREKIDSACHMKGIAGGIGCRIISPIIDLNLVALIDCQFPVVGWIIVAEHWEANEYAGIVGSIDSSPINRQGEIGELLFRIPQQSDAVLTLDGIGADNEKAARAGHLPAIELGV